MHITCIRHLPTGWNEARKLQGKRNIDILPATSHDLRQLTHNKKILKRFTPFDIVLSSTLNRTIQTAKLYGFQSIKEPILDELDFGEFEGLSKDLLIEEIGNKWFDQPINVKLGETMGNFERRIIAFIEKYRHFSNVLLFGHGSWIRGLMSIARYKNINQMNKMNLENNQCILIQLEENGENEVFYFDDDVNI